MVNVQEDDAKVNPYTMLNVLQNKIKYGVSSQTAISICEKFNDRVSATKISEILMSKTIDTDNILRVTKYFEESVLNLLKDYPRVFFEKISYLLK